MVWCFIDLGMARSEWDWLYSVSDWTVILVSMR